MPSSPSSDGVCATSEATQMMLPPNSQPPLLIAPDKSSPGGDPPSSKAMYAALPLLRLQPQTSMPPQRQVPPPSSQRGFAPAPGSSFRCRVPDVSCPASFQQPSHRLQELEESTAAVLAAAPLMAGSEAGLPAHDFTSQHNILSAPIPAQISCKSAETVTGSTSYTSAMPLVPILVANQLLSPLVMEAAEPAALSSAPGVSQPALQPLEGVHSLLGNVTESQAVQPSARDQNEAAAASGAPEAFHLTNNGGGTNNSGNWAAADGLLPPGLGAQSPRHLLGLRLPSAGSRTVARFKDLQQRAAAVQRTGSQPLPEIDFLSSRNSSSCTSAAATIPNPGGLTVSSSTILGGSSASSGGRPDRLERCKSVPTPTSTLGAQRSGGRQGPLTLAQLERATMAGLCHRHRAREIPSIYWGLA